MFSLIFFPKFIFISYIYKTKNCICNLNSEKIIKTNDNEKNPDFFNRIYLWYFHDY